VARRRFDLAQVGQQFGLAEIFQLLGQHLRVAEDFSIRDMVDDVVAATDSLVGKKRNRLVLDIPDWRADDSILRRSGSNSAWPRSSSSSASISE
jgi:hypothetical protein